MSIRVKESFLVGLALVGFFFFLFNNSKFKLLTRRNCLALVLKATVTYLHPHISLNKRFWKQDKAARGVKNRGGKAAGSWSYGFSRNPASSFCCLQNPQCHLGAPWGPMTLSRLHGAVILSPDLPFLNLILSLICSGVFMQYQRRISVII